MKKKMLVAGGCALAVLVGVPLAVSAMPPGMGKMMMNGPMKRADVEAQVKEHFGRVDVNRDGAVTREEMQTVHKAMRGEMMGRMFDRLDSDRNGAISREEFLAGHEGKGGHHGGGEAHGGHGMKGHGMMGHGMMGGRMFERADANSDGKVTLAEATAAALAKFDKADANKDGQITPEERKAQWQAKRDAWNEKAGREKAGAARAE